MLWTIKDGSRMWMRWMQDVDGSRMRWEQDVKRPKAIHGGVQYSCLVVAMVRRTCLKA